MTILLLLLLFFAVTGWPTTNFLDPKQLTALESMNLPVDRDPCSSSNPASSYAVCDSASPFRHVISLRLSNCSPNLSLSPILLSRLHNLTHLSLINVPLSPSSSPALFSHMPPNLITATISNASLSGQLPRRRWHSLSLTRLDLSLNLLKGPLPPSIALLESLRFLNLSSNSLSGPLPEEIGDLIFLQTLSLARNSFSGPIPNRMAAMPDLAVLDLSFNRFNGSIPRFLAEMRSLRWLNLEGNDFQGVVPFDAAFIGRMEVLIRVGGNANLCYNRSLLSDKLVAAGIVPPCDKYGLPVLPPPGKEEYSFSDYDYAGVVDDGDRGKKKGVNWLVLGVALALSCLVFLLFLLVCLYKLCRS